MSETMSYIYISLISNYTTFAYHSFNMVYTQHDKCLQLNAPTFASDNISLSNIMYNRLDMCSAQTLKRPIS